MNNDNSIMYTAKYESYIMYICTYIYCAIFFLLLQTNLYAQTSSVEIYHGVIDTLQLSDYGDMTYNNKYGLLIADSRELKVWIISPSGTCQYLHKPGQGPGEYMRIDAIAWGNNGRIIVADRSNKRVIVYDSDLESEKWYENIWAQDVTASEDQDIYINETGSGEGPVIRIDQISMDRSVLRKWRDSKNITGQPLERIASLAFIQWDEYNKYLLVGYRMDAKFEIYCNNEYMREFNVPSNKIIYYMHKMQNERSHILTLRSFCLLDRDRILSLVAGELFIMDYYGNIISRSDAPEHLRVVCAGPSGYVFTLNENEMKIEINSIYSLMAER